MREPIRAPDAPPADRPTANPAELKADINAGETGDKVEVFDPAAAPLGVDEEAAGTPTSGAQMASARVQERGRGEGHADPSHAALERGGQRRVSPTLLLWAGGIILALAIVLLLLA